MDDKGTIKLVDLLSKIHILNLIVRSIRKKIDEQPPKVTDLWSLRISRSIKNIKSKNDLGNLSSLQETKDTWHLIQCMSLDYTMD